MYLLIVHQPAVTWVKNYHIYSTLKALFNYTSSALNNKIKNYTPSCIYCTTFNTSLPTSHEIL